VSTRSACILGVGTAVPPYTLEQSLFKDRLLKRSLTREKTRYLERILSNCGIEKRHTALSLEEDGTIVYKGTSIDRFSTAERNAIYAQEVIPLALEASRNALNNADIDPSSITHVITVTCTGFTNPGFDFELVSGLCLSPSVHRYSLGFMGCYAAFPALELATAISQSDPSARILCVCAEICSLHFQPDSTFDDLLASTLFADGAGAIIVGNDHGEQPQIPQIVDFRSEIIPDSEREMAWSIGDNGFSLVLSPYVSRIIGLQIKSLVPKEWAPVPALVEHWLIHPGGKSILDRVQESLELDPQQLCDSRDVLKTYGNMSSATIVFVLQKLLQSGKYKEGQSVAMLGFGPGLTGKQMFLTSGE
jgi:alkylresorcinol/alkylpyrone synthase